MVVRGRRRLARVSYVSRGVGGFTDEGHFRYYEPVPRMAVEAVVRDLAKLWAMDLIAGDAAKERVLSVSPLTFLGFISRFCLEISLRNLGEPRSIDLF